MQNERACVRAAAGLLSSSDQDDRPFLRLEAKSRDINVMPDSSDGVAAPRDPLREFDEWFRALDRVRSTAPSRPRVLRAIYTRIIFI